MSEMTSIEDVKKVLKSILVSKPVILRVHELNQEHKKLIGVNIPYEKFGFDDLVEFLKSMPDLLKVNGRSLNSTVDICCERIRHTEKRKKRKPKKGTGVQSNNQIALRTNQSPTRCNFNITPVGNGTKYSRNSSRDGIQAHLTNPLGLNIDMHIDYKAEKLQFAAEIDYGRIASIKRKHLAGKIEEALNEMQKNEMQELRYPKSETKIEKQDAEIRGNLFQSTNTTRKLIEIDRHNHLSTIHEECQIEENYAKNPKKNTHSKSSIQARLLLNRHSEETAPTTSIMDEPVPSTLPEVPEEFTTSKSTDLIDLRPSAIPNGPFPSRTKPDALGWKKLPFIEVLRMVKKIQKLEAK